MHIHFCMNLTTPVNSLLTWFFIALLSAVLWLKVSSFEFDCNKLLDVCPEEKAQLYCRNDNEESNTILWFIKSSIPDKTCWTSFGYADLYGTTHELQESCRGRARLVSKVPISTNLSLLLTPDLVDVTCSPDSSSPGQVCSITFKGKPGGLTGFFLSIQGQGVSR